MQTIVILYVYSMCPSLVISINSYSYAQLQLFYNISQLESSLEYTVHVQYIYSLFIFH